MVVGRNRGQACRVVAFGMNTQLQNSSDGASTLLLISRRRKEFGVNAASVCVFHTPVRHILSLCSHSPHIPHSKMTGDVVENPSRSMIRLVQSHFNPLSSRFLTFALNSFKSPMPCLTCPNCVSCCQVFDRLAF